ncbi:MAG TPA: hypothetical protein PKE64_09270 [Anaerolineae bacterium]|nr:hypothetical protein [Anaerolineae bacterium]HMR64186.1 hypothetical protein [Anaerolineae bacterium]
MSTNSQSVLTKEEIEHLAVAISEGQGDFSEEDFFVLVKWAEGIKLDIGLLENVLDGNLSVKVEQGKVHFALTPQGLKKFEYLKTQNSHPG